MLRAHIHASRTRALSRPYYIMMAEQVGNVILAQDSQRRTRQAPIAVRETLPHLLNANQSGRTRDRA